VRYFEIRDPVYGFIKFNEKERKIIDHPVFQRLRRIRQLGLTDMVYPGAMHTRFEHSLGVMHLATRMFDAITSEASLVEILSKSGYDKSYISKDREIVRLAALLHDIGHGPFSHMSEEIMPENPQTGKPFKHEDYTIALIRDRLGDILGEEAEEVIALLSKGDIRRLGMRVFWRSLLTSQLDADRCDYLLRDSLHTGVKYGIYDIDRLIVTLSIGEKPEPEDGLEVKDEFPNLAIGVEEGGLYVAESLVVARYHIYEQVYYHKTRVAYDVMLREALKETFGQLPPPNNIDEFLKLDDYSTWNLIKEKSPKWFEMIKNREPLKEIIREEESSTEKYQVLKETLKESGIQIFEKVMELVEPWYDKGSEIWVIRNGKCRPLSECSPIVKNLPPLLVQRRLYVKPEDFGKANKLKEQIIKKGAYK